MIMTVDELRQFVKTDEEDQTLEAKLQALELLVRAYTNNNFQVRAFRAVAVSIADHDLLCNGVVVGAYLGSAKQILNPYVLDMLQSNFAVSKLA